jgi:hypothetical protein
MRDRIPRWRCGARSPNGTAKPPIGVKGDLAGASMHYNRALAALRTGDWAQFGTEMQQAGMELGQPADSAHH